MEHIDTAALSLRLTGIEIPRYLQARDVLSEAHQRRTAIFAARDRCDATVDPIRALRTARYKYIRNFLPCRPRLQPNRYKEGKYILRALRKAYAAGTLNETQKLLLAPTRTKEELYDLTEDAFEAHNRVGNPQCQSQRNKPRKRLDE